MLNLDTNIILHAAAGTLNFRERELLAENSWSISSIVLWEIAKLSQKERIEMHLDHPAVVQALDEVHVYPITASIAQASVNLDFDADPADELIAATSILHHVPLLTRDSAINRSKLVPLA